MEIVQKITFLKEQLKILLNDDKNNPIILCHVDKELFIDLAISYISNNSLCKTCEGKNIRIENNCIILCGDCN